MKEVNIEYVFGGESSGELARSKSLVEIYHLSKDIKEFDRSHYIYDKYYFEVEYENGDINEIGQTILYRYEVNIRKYKNKIYCKPKKIDI